MNEQEDYLEEYGEDVECHSGEEEVDEDDPFADEDEMRNVRMSEMIVGLMLTR